MRLVKLGEVWINPDQVTRVEKDGTNEKMGQTRITLTGNLSAHHWVDLTVAETCRELTSGHQRAFLEALGQSPYVPRVTPREHKPSL